MVNVQKNMNKALDGHHSFYVLQENHGSMHSVLFSHNLVPIVWESNVLWVFLMDILRRFSYIDSISGKYITLEVRTQNTVDIFSSIAKVVFDERINCIYIFSKRNSGIPANFIKIKYAEHDNFFAFIFVNKAGQKKI